MAGSRGRSGRRPQPTKLKLLHGNPGKRRLNDREPEPDTALPDPPAHLSDEAQAEWRRVGEVLLSLGLVSNVWTIQRPSESPLPPTMKPLELVERALGNSSKAGDTVLDPFLGSGTTLIAAERTGRVCLGMELDPRYVDVAVRRWEAFTGGKAEREKKGDLERFGLS